MVAEVIGWVKSRDTVADTPITMAPTDTVGEALSLLPKRAHGAIIVTDGAGAPVGIVTEADCTGVDRFAQLRDVMTLDPVSLPAGIRRPRHLLCCTRAGTGWLRWWTPTGG